MKLVASRIAHADTIVTDDGVILGIIYYQAVPIDDTNRPPKEIFREWFEKAEATIALHAQALKMGFTWEERDAHIAAAIKQSDNHLTAEPKDGDDPNTPSTAG